MVTAKQKSTIGIHKKRKKISTHNIKDSHQIIREQKKKGEKTQKTLEKVIQNN